MVRLQWLSNSVLASTKSYNSYTECYNQVIDTAEEGSKNYDLKEKLDPIMKGLNGLGLLKEMEDKFNCAGACETPLFYVSKDVTQRPT
jgi:hypothetical protein